jgi:HK97 gp10 family phage protein
MAEEFNHWLDVANAMEPACSEAVSKAARAGEMHVATQIIINGQVLTGNMLNSVYSSTPEGSTYESVDRGLPEVTPESSSEAIIGVSADYAIFPNYGTVYQSARPFWEPGLDDTAGDYEQAMEEVVQKLEAAAH